MHTHLSWMGARCASYPFSLIVAPTVVGRVRCLGMNAQDDVDDERPSMTLVVVRK